MKLANLVIALQDIHQGKPILFAVINAIESRGSFVPDEPIDGR